MSQYVETPTKTFFAGAAIGEFLRVHLAAGKLALSGAADVSIGTMEREAFAADEQVAVRLRSAQGTKKMVASGAIGEGVKVYGAAGGKIGTAAGANLEGISLEAATADNDVIEVLPLGPTG